MDYIIGLNPICVAGLEGLAGGSPGCKLGLYKQERADKAAEDPESDKYSPSEKKHKQ